MQISRAWTTGVLVLACTPSTPTAKPDPQVRPATTPDAPALLEEGGPRTHLLVERHALEEPQAYALPLALTGEGLRPLAEVSRPAMPHPSWPGHYTTTAGHGGAARWVSGEASGAGWKLVARTIGEDATREVSVPAIPSALLVVGEVVLVGAGNMVGAIDLAAEAPAWTEVHQRPDMRFKAYDLFARAGTWVVAIDDVVRPIYADSFRLDARGWPTHRAGWTLPGLINGHYTAAALTATEPGEGTLYAVAPYGILDGHGQDLAALEIRGDAPTAAADTILNGARSLAPPVLEEHVSRATGKPEKSIAGTDVTPWRGMAVDAGRVLLAAEARGLLVVPTNFTPDTRARVVELGGSCHDVLVADGRTWALVGGASSAVVELAWTGDAAREVGRTPLPQSYDRFVR